MSQWRPDGWVTIKAKNHPLHCFTPNDCVGQSYEAGADAMHDADVAWLIQRITHDDRGYVFNMTDKEWQEFIGWGECLCLNCELMDDCGWATEFYNMCKDADIALAVTRCPEWKEKFVI